MPIDSHLSYLEKNAFRQPEITEPPHPGLGLVVVIPCFDEPDLIGSLEALRTCEAPGCAVEVITVINSGVQHGGDIRQQNLQTLQDARAWAAAHSTDLLRFHFIHVPDLPKKHAGVGLARKIGMDEAVNRLQWVERPEGVILCFDADSRCDPNYLQAVEAHFHDQPTTEACSIYYEHPLEGEFEEEVYQAILRYELYLRYYVLALRYAGHPHAFHTIGSSMAVRSSAYQAQGGMNRRKAGEDFHFLQKFIPLGHFSELRSTRVIPSPRISDRVPFGTGKAVGDWVEDPQLDYPVYAPVIFEELKAFLAEVNRICATEHGLPPDLPKRFGSAVEAYFEELGFAEEVEAIAGQTNTPAMFHKRFYRWFNGLRVLQFVHHARDHFHANVSIQEAAAELMNWYGLSPDGEGLRGALTAVRNYERFGSQ